ncbi:MAG: Eco57I restriction-modification methylase domain-containing protein [Rubrivivax sp.]|jgi:hypothetical protein|nr:Eco57I restriction-modification methylase domain-containing protein [Rubrivivax sp.]
MIPAIALRQSSFLETCPITAAVEALANAGGVDERGAIFTKREVVDFILDLCGYTADRPLHQLRVLEPSFGGGDFLLPAIDRLLSAWRSSGKPGDPLNTLKGCIRAVELHRGTFTRTHAAVIARLVGEGIAARAATALVDEWLVFGDFLLADLDEGFDLVIGNPPYVRQELIPDVLMAEYRARYSTIYDRADLYVPFIERSLRLLAPRGVLGFICADRWMKNRYGARLRSLVADGYHLRAYIDMTDTPAFHTDVVAYPAITVIARENGAATRIAHRPAIDSVSLGRLAKCFAAKNLPDSAEDVREISAVTAGEEPWILDSSDQMQLLRRLERDFPALEDTGCKVGIGVATGADKAFIGPYEALDVEDDRKLPLVMTRDIQTGRVEWRGSGVINPFNDGPGSGLVNLDDYPRMKRYLEARKADIAGRHVAQKSPANWYRTIDRITPSLASRPKLLIPDIKGQAQIVFEDGKLYPHHNLYFVTSDEWDLKALQAVLLSAVTKLFVASYSTKMRGGFLRFQAQYLRRIRLPKWSDVPDALRRDLRDAAEALDTAACDHAVFRLYKLTPAERAAIGGNSA